MCKKSDIQLINLEKESQNGNVIAMYQLAEHYAEGEKRKISPNLKKALRYMRESSDGGYKLASYQLFRISAGYAVLTRNFQPDSEPRRSQNSKYESPFDEIKAIENKELELDPNSAIQYLERVTDNENLSSNALVNIAAVSQPLIRGKISWAEEYIHGNLLEKDVNKACKITASVFDALEMFISSHFEKIDGQSLGKISKKLSNENYFLHECIWRLQKIFFSAHRENANFIGQKLIQRGLLFASKVKAFPELMQAKQFKIMDQNIRLEINSKVKDMRGQARYCGAIRSNPDGNSILCDVSRNRDEPLDSNIKYLLDLSDVDLINTYKKIVKPPTFDPISIEKEIVLHESIKSLMESDVVREIKNAFLSLYYPDTRFLSQYIDLLQLNNQPDCAKICYEKSLFIYRRMKTKKSEKQQELDILKQKILKPLSVSFDEYKQVVIDKLGKENPCVLYDQYKSVCYFDQKVYEKCRFLVGGEFSVSKEMLRYTTALKKGGKFLGFELSRNREHANYLLSFMADYVVKKHSDNFDMVVRRESEIAGIYSEIIIQKYFPYGKEKVCRDPVLDIYLKPVILGTRLIPQKSLDLLNVGIHEGPDMDGQIIHGQDIDRSIYTNESDNSGKESENDKKDGELHIKVLKQFIKSNNNKDDQKLKRYYDTLQVLVGKRKQSDISVLSEVLFDKKSYSNKIEGDYRSIIRMTSGNNYYHGTVDNFFELANNPYQNNRPWGYIYPVRYDARLKFIRYISRIKSLDNKVQVQGDPFAAYAAFMLCKYIEIWKASNADIIPWLGSKTFKELDGSPYGSPDSVEDENIRDIILAIKAKEENVEYSKALEIDQYEKYLKNIDKYIAASTEGAVKIPEMLLVRALLCLGHSHEGISNLELRSQINQFYSRDLNLWHDPTRSSVGKITVIDTFELFPFVNELMEKIQSGVPKEKRFEVALGYLEDLVTQYTTGIFSSTSHKSLIYDVMSLKTEIEKEIQTQRSRKLHEQEKELAVERAERDKEHEMLSYLTHTLRNSLADGPKKLEQCIRLLGTDDYDDSNRKYKAINHIASQLSTFSVVNTLISTFKQYVGDPKTFLSQWNEDTQGSADIECVVSFCLRQCISRALFFPNYQRVIKRLIEDNSGSFIKKTRKNYIENILSLADDDSPTEKITQWIEEYLPNIDIIIDENSPEFSMNNIKYTYLFSIFSELIWNAFKHTDGKYPIRIHWESSNGNYIFTVKNHYIEDEMNLESSTNKGLVFIERLLSIFPDAALDYKIAESNTFISSIKLPHNIFHASEEE